jgi:ABC-type phosphate transport system substrate-binding protein
MQNKLTPFTAVTALWSFMVVTMAFTVEATSCADNSSLDDTRTLLASLAAAATASESGSTTLAPVI